MLLQDRTLPELLAAQARQHGPRTFLLFQEERITYAGLQEEANRIALLLEGLGVRKGDKLALLLDNCPLWVSIFFGAAAAGAVLVPLNPRYSAEELARVLQHSEASGLIYAGLYRTAVQQAQASCPQLSWTLPAEELRDRLRESPARPLASPVAVGPEDLVAIIYTSGTTGSPKGVMLSHWNYVSNAWQAARWKKMTPEDRYLTAMPLCHVAPQVGAVLAHLCAGGSVALLDGFSPEGFLAALSRYKATGFAGVPTVYAIFLALPNRERFDFSSLRYCNTSAAPMPLELRERVRKAFKTDPLESYGLVGRQHAGAPAIRSTGCASRAPWACRWRASPCAWWTNAAATCLSVRSGSCGSGARTS